MPKKYHMKECLWWWDAPLPHHQPQPHYLCTQCWPSFSVQRSPHTLPSSTSPLHSGAFGATPLLRGCSRKNIFFQKIFDNFFSFQATEIVLTSKWGRIQPEIQIWHVQLVAASWTLVGSPKHAEKMLIQLITLLHPRGPQWNAQYNGRKNILIPCKWVKYFHP